MTGQDPDAIARRLARERKARREAEAIAERVTAELYATIGKLEQVNTDLESANQSIKEFVAIASHDLRNPLTVILGMSDMLLDRSDDLSAEQRERFLSAIKDQGLSLERLVQDLLTLSKLDAGVLDTVSIEIAVESAIGKLIDGMGSDAANIDVDLDDGLVVLADSDHVDRIFRNYLTNAFKYGQPPVEVHGGTSGPFVQVAVQDRGAGVPPELESRLFGRFVRGDPGTTGRRDGTGLGLSIVRGLAQANGGDAWYEPLEPHGSSFLVKLPAAG